MTREDQIKKQADIYTDDSSNYTEWFDGWSDTNDIELIEKAFVEGAKWADEHPNLNEEEQVGMGGLGMIWQKKELIKKACDWLRKQVYQEYPGGPLERLITDEMIDNFKKVVDRQV